MPLTEQTAVVLDRPKSGGPFRGEIVHVADAYVVQKMGFRTLIIHDRAQLAERPEKGVIPNLRRQSDGVFCVECKTIQFEEQSPDIGNHQRRKWLAGTPPNVET